VADLKFGHYKGGGPTKERQEGGVKPPLHVGVQGVKRGNRARFTVGRRAPTLATCENIGGNSGRVAFWVWG